MDRQGVPATSASDSHVYVLRGGALPPLVPRYCRALPGAAEGQQDAQVRHTARQEDISVDRLKPHLGYALASPAGFLGEAGLPLGTNGLICD